MSDLRSDDEHILDDRGDETVEAELEAATGGAQLRQTSLWGDAVRKLRRNPLFIFGASISVVLILMAIFPSLFTNADPRACNLANSRQGPSSEAWFGYDVQGCDYFSNVVYGARNSITIGFVVVIGSLIIGVFLGAMSGYYGGKADTIITRLTDIMFGLPQILGSIVILTVLNQQFGRNVGTVSFALIVLGWMVPLRLLRSSVISVKGADYVSAARAMGSRTRRIISRHVLPNSLGPVLVYGTIAVGTIISAEATLSYLGIGLQLPDYSWGLQINSGQRWVRDAPHLVLFPGIFLSVTVLSFILMGDALRDALDPKNR
ncbi:MAG TPA: ABC transporter permease [Jiangellales bacterium]|nr:ABC transporter permease [Jiangellales bacterium]